MDDWERAEVALRETQGELAHLNRLMTVGELTSSIAHEINQPLAAIVMNGNAALRWLALNSTPSIGLYKEAEVALCSAGIGDGIRVRGLLYHLSFG